MVSCDVILVEQVRTAERRNTAMQQSFCPTWHGHNCTCGGLRVPTQHDPAPPQPDVRRSSYPVQGTTAVQALPLVSCACRYGAQFVMEYVDATTGAGVLNVGENWPPLVGKRKRYSG